MLPIFHWAVAKIDSVLETRKARSALNWTLVVDATVDRNTHHRRLTVKAMDI